MKIIEKNNKKGITLIALVITIIVLLILAGVSIAMLTGDNSLLGNAQKTGPANNIGAAKDEVGLAYNTAMQEYYETKYASTNGTNGTFATKLETAINEITSKGKSHGCGIVYDKDAGTITITNGGYKVIGTVDTTDGSAGISWGEMKETTGIDLDKVTLKLNIADDSTKTGTLTATLSKISGNITWTSDNSSIATVSGSDKTATVTGVATGSTTITATCSGKTSTCKVIVTNGQVVGYDDIVKNPKDYYGKAVKNYTLTDKTADGKDYIFRIFYAGKDIDGEERIYLRADPCDGTGLSTTTYDAMSADGKTILKNQNPQWADIRLNSSSTWNNNEKATAWLCDPNNFTEKYKPTGELANKVKYVIGAPGVEMYVKSYNQTHPGGYTYNGTKYGELGATYSATGYPGYIYTLGGNQSTVSNTDYWTGNNTIDNSGFEQMYCKPNTAMWLASPSARGDDRVCGVYGNRANLGIGNFSGTGSLVPLVSLSSDVQLQI